MLHGKREDSEVEMMTESNRSNKWVARNLQVAIIGVLGVAKLPEGPENFAIIANELLLPNIAFMILIFLSNFTCISS